MILYNILLLYYNILRILHIIIKNSIMAHIISHTKIFDSILQIIY